MLSSPETEYAPLAGNADGYDDESRSSKEEASNDQDFEPTTSKSSLLPKVILYGSLVVACLSSLNVLLLPLALTAYIAHPYSESALQNLPWPDTRLGLDRAAKMIPPPKSYSFAWPEKIARVSQVLKNAVYGDGTQVYITVEDSTIMEFLVPSEGGPACVLTFRPPPEFSARVNDLQTKGDITEIEAWSIIAPNPAMTSADGEIDFDNLSWNTRPVQGELLGTLDLTRTPNATTVEFACPRETDSLTVEFRCLRVACHVAFKQVDMLPRFGFELARRLE